VAAFATPDLPASELRVRIAELFIETVDHAEALLSPANGIAVPQNPHSAIRRPMIHDEKWHPGQRQPDVWTGW
jgi:hypothetical protein